MLEVNAVVRMTIKGVLQSEEVANVLHFRVLDPAGIAAPDVSLATIAAFWANGWDNEQVNVFNWHGWDAVQVRGTDVTYDPATGKYSGGQTFEGNISPVISGDLAQDPLPPATAAVVSLRTGFSGRTRRGRCYIPGLGEAASTGGSPTPAEVTALQAIADTFKGAYGAGGGNLLWRWGIFSYRIATDRYTNPLNPKQTLYGGNPDPDNAFKDITLCTVDPQWGSMRSRSFIS